MTLAQRQNLVPGQIVGGHYQIVRLLDAGNFGETYLAEDLHAMNRKCVVKLLSFFSKDPATFAKAKELFKREASALQRLSEPPRTDRIPRFYAYFDENQQFYLVQELIEGYPLSDELRGGRKLGEEQVIELLEDVLQVLKFIHSEGMIHRDIKPDNLMRRARDRKLILIDFGAVKEAVVQTSASTLIYTPGYAPKEQHQGAPKPNSDIYALGIIAIQALTGLEPGELPKDPRTGEIIWHEQAQASDKLVQIIDKMVRDNWKRRYQTADEVLEALQKLKNTLVVVPPIGQQLNLINQQYKTNLFQPNLWLFFVILAPLVAVISFAIAFLVKPPLTTNPTVSTPAREEHINSKSSENSASSIDNKPSAETKSSSEPGNRQKSVFPETERNTETTSGDRSNSDTTNQPDTEVESPIRFKRSLFRETSATQPVEPSITPNPTSKDEVESPIRFKRSKPRSAPNSP